MTDNARAFMEANQRSPIVSGAVIGRGGQGSSYTLKDGKRFTLNRDECVAIGQPRWDLGS